MKNIPITYIGLAEIVQAINAYSENNKIDKNIIINHVFSNVLKIKDKDLFKIEKHDKDFNKIKTLNIIRNKSGMTQGQLTKKTYFMAETERENILDILEKEKLIKKVPVTICHNPTFEYHYVQERKKPTTKIEE